MAARLLAGLAAGLVLGGGTLAWWLTEGERDAPVAVAPHAALAPPPRAEEHAHAPRVARDVERAAETSGEPEPEPLAAPTPFGAWDPPRNTPAFDGAVVETWFDEGRPEFLGTQVLDADGRWQLDGAWSAWHENGTPMERGAYRLGREDGPWQWWYEDGTPMAQGTWVEGRRVGRWTFWQENGALGAVGHYAEGHGDGPWTLYHEDGTPWISGELACGQPVGLWQVWNEDGTLDQERTGVWKDGEFADSDP